MSARDDLIIRALPLGDQWNTYGADAASGIVPTGVKLGVDDWGPHDIAFSLNRDPGVAFADLGASTPLEALIGDGDPLWTGRTSQSPTDEANRAISVVGEGWQAHLDDDDFWKTYVHSSLSDFVDVRTLPSAQLGQGVGFHPASCQVASDASGISLMFPGNTGGSPAPTVGAFEGCSVQLDMGPANVAVRVVADIDTSNNGSTAVACFCFVGDDPRPQQGTHQTMFGVNANAATYTNLGSGVSATTPARYVSIRMQVAASPVTPSADIWVKIKRLLVFTAAAYESSGASVLFASTVIKDALTHAPLLSQDTSAIATTAFAIPDLTMSGYQTSRQLATAVNAYHAYQIRVRADKVLEFRPRPAYPLLMNIKGTFQDTSAGSLAAVYNRCAGLATGPDGVQIVSNQVPSPDLTIPGRRGYTRTNALDTNMALTQTALDQLCQTFIASHGRMPFQGTLTVVGWDSVAFTVGGAAVAAWELLRYVGEMIHFPNLVDPDTGAKGRDGRIAAVTYDHDSRTSSVAIDSQLANFEALLARLQIVTGRVA